MKKLFAKSLLIAALLVFFVAVPSHAWLIVTDIGASNEIIDNSTDGFIDFQGRGGANNTDVRLDLDGTHPIFSSATDSAIEIAGTAILNTVTIATALTISEDFVISLNAADEEITINQTNTSGTEGVGLIKINDDRTGATATGLDEPTIWIDAEGVYAIAAVDGAIAAEGGFFPTTVDGSALGSTALEFSDLFLADSAAIKFGDDSDVSLIHDPDTGLLLNSTMQLQFGDTGTYIHQSADGILSVVSDTTVDVTSVTFNVGVDAAAYLSIVTTNGGETTISQTSDGTDQITIGDNADLVLIEAGNWDVDSSGNITTTGDIGSATVEIDDIFMQDSSVIWMGADQDVVITHVADAGVTMRVTADAGFIIVLQTSDTTITDGSELGRINFQAPLDSSGTDAILVGAAIYAEADIEFAIDANATDLVFETAVSETAVETMRLISTGYLGINTSDPATLLEVQGDAGAPGTATLSTAELTVDDGDELGRINFQAPLETGADAILVVAAIYAEADATFDATTNTTDLVFATALGAVAGETARLTSAGDFNVTGAIMGYRKITSASGSRVLTTPEMRGGIVLVTAAAVEVSVPDLCDSATGAWVTIVQADASETIQIGVTDTADLLFVDGASIGANQEIDSPGSAVEGDFITLYCRETDEWHVLGQQGTWVDGGASD